MVEYSRRHLWDRKTFPVEHHRKQMETDMTYRRTGPFTGYEETFDEAARDTSHPWLPPAPVADTEASETRGVSQTFSSIVDATLTERGKNYGDFTDNADYAQRIKQVFYDSKAWHSMPTYMQEALDLIASKFGRMLSGDPFYPDNWHDVGGYTTLVEQRIKQRSKR